LEGNRVLRLFAHALKETSREYDYVARMGGDEFVVIAPGLTPEATARKAEQMRELAQSVGRDVCNEDILSLSVGKSVYPEDGLDAEKLLSQADKRMYLQKQIQPSRANRRLFPRVRGRMMTEILLEGQPGPVFGMVTNMGPGGCYAETTSIIHAGSKLTLSFALGTTQVKVQGESVRMDIGVGVGIKFLEPTHEVRTALQRIMEQLASAEQVSTKNIIRNAAAGKPI